MPTLTTIRYQGGPCDGNTLPWDIVIPLPASLTCGGHIYKAAGSVPGEYIYKDAGQIKSGTKALSGVNAAWSRLMRNLGHRAPADLRRIHNSTVRIRRLTRHHR